MNLSELLQRIHALLNIEWIYDQPKTTTPNAAPQGEISTLVKPRRSDIEDLIRLGQIGYVRGIIDKLNEIEGGDHAEFVHHLRAAVDRFDLRRFMAMLEGP